MGRIGWGELGWQGGVGGVGWWMGLGMVMVGVWRLLGSVGGGDSVGWWVICYLWDGVGIQDNFFEKVRGGEQYKAITKEGQYKAVIYSSSPSQ